MLVFVVVLVLVLVLVLLLLLRRLGRFRGLTPRRAVPSCDWLFGTFEDGTRWSKEHVQKLRAKADKGNLDPTIADTAEQMAAIDAAQGKGVETQANPAAEGKKKA
eukprot:COSAG04_NODE_5215_length_1700_cov_1.740162_1_plen_105_part_00